MDKPGITADDIREALLSLSGDQVMSILMEINKPTIVADIMDYCNSNVASLIEVIKRAGLELEVIEIFRSANDSLLESISYEEMV